MSVSLRVWHWYSIDQARAAHLFAREALDLETDPPPPNEDEKTRGLVCSEATMFQHRARVTASVLASVAFLEASINETFASAAHPNLEVGGQLPTEEQAVVRDLRPLVMGIPTLDKFQVCLVALGRSSFDKGASPYQDVSTLIRFRNALVHYDPKWRGGAEESAGLGGLERALQSNRFSLNPFTGEGNPFFPDKVLSAGAAEWSWTAALAFSDAFFDKLGVSPPYANIRSSLI